MKIIKTPAQHLKALERFDDLAARSETDLTRDQQDEQELLLVLIEQYERNIQPAAAPDPLAAIRFRMEQMGYHRKDLAALLGAASRASEVLAGKRALSVSMMRRLRDEWGIPADSLLGPPEEPQDGPAARSPLVTAPERAPEDYPMKQMYDRDYFRGRGGNWKEDRRDRPGLLVRLFGPGGGGAPLPCLLRQGGGATAKINPHALEAWRQRVLTRAADEHATIPVWDAKELDTDYLRWLAGLSPLPDGPRLACEALAACGLPVLIEPRLDETHLDGAAMLDANGRPVIGLTLRHNRLDNFWFTLFHEIGHVLRHLSADRPALFDSEIDQRKTGSIETEADRFALDTLIPPEAWEGVRNLKSAADIRATAARLRRHPAVLAGRLRREENDYRKHRTLLGNGEVRAAFGFTEKTWPK